MIRSTLHHKCSFNKHFHISKRLMAVRELPWCSPMDSPNRRKKDEVDNLEGDRQHKLTPIDRFGIVAAMSRNRVIGVDGKLPWNLPEDRKAFKALTENKVLIIGRRTFEEEPNQCHISHTAKCIVVSKSLPEDFSTDRIRLAHSFPEALHMARELVDEMKPEQELEDIYCWVAGGEKIYQEALLHPSASCLHLAIVDTDIDIKTEDGEASDITMFPAKYRWDHIFKEVSREEHPYKSNNDEMRYTQYIFRPLRGLR